MDLNRLATGASERSVGRHGGEGAGMHSTVERRDDESEILDVLWRTDPDSGERLPVSRADAVAGLHTSGQFRTARLVARLPHDGHHLDPAAVDRVFLEVHCELARLSETLCVPERMASVIRPLIAQVREREGDGPVRVVDVGCGLGFDMRSMAAHGLLGPDVEHWGLDLNSLLVEVARTAADDEDLPVTFTVGDAFEAAPVIEEPARTILVSQSLLHHLGPTRLPDFFGHHRDVGVAAFAHFDVNPGFWSTVGGWVLHRARMRHPVARHDGNVSMRRALSAAVLLDCATSAVGEAYSLECDGRRSWMPEPHRALRPVVGVRR